MENSIFRVKFDKKIKKSRIEFCKYYLYIVDNARYVYTDESHFYKRILIVKDGYFKVKNLMKNKENHKTKE